jgi:hypothetical protein
MPLVGFTSRGPTTGRIEEAGANSNGLSGVQDKA